ncbi:hypothetical protein IEQ34_009926 [Dendrobium chrysotoxum]|uniref:Uncharacterized protein n=1 Tax=Dendrobium chrysotoxum TaxID=161865 RepID=A0AAV7H1S4_DENCH|nr:hypothetical protein IEQ34_009926 [Dendrobium chrysotoxum]
MLVISCGKSSAWRNQQFKDITYRHLDIFLKKFIGNLTWFPLNSIGSVVVSDEFISSKTFDLIISTLKSI